MDNGIQVCARSKKTSRMSSQSQTEWTVLGTQDAATQHLGEGKSYEKYRENKAKSKWTYDRLKEKILCNKDRLIGWLMDEKLGVGNADIAMR